MVAILIAVAMFLLVVAALWCFLIILAHVSRFWLWCDRNPYPKAKE
jgi:hypothetical protein